MSSERSRRRAATSSAAEQRDRWLVSYADFITLLFAVFTTLYAISAVDAKRAHELVRAIEASFQSERQDEGETGAQPTFGAHPQLQDEEQLRERAQELRREFAASNGIDVRESSTGLVLSLADSFAFEPGGDVLAAGASPALVQIARMLKDFPNHIRVEGHTDDRPIASDRFPSNWHLSSARAVAVLLALEQAGLPAHRLSAAGFAGERPLVSNDTPDGRSINRRVDVVILRTGQDASS